MVQGGWCGEYICSTDRLCSPLPAAYCGIVRQPGEQVTLGLGITCWIGQHVLREGVAEEAQPCADAAAVSIIGSSQLCWM